MLVEQELMFPLNVDEPRHFSSLSTGSLFESAADGWGPDLTSIVLSGASRDGARGSRAVCAGGGRVLLSIRRRYICRS